MLIQTAIYSPCRWHPSVRHFHIIYKTLSYKDFYALVFSVCGGIPIDFIRLSWVPLWSFCLQWKEGYPDSRSFYWESDSSPSNTFPTTGKNHSYGYL